MLQSVLTIHLFINKILSTIVVSNTTKPSITQINNTFPEIIIKK